MPHAFPNGAFRYADKSLKSRGFFCALKQGNSRARLQQNGLAVFHLPSMAQLLAEHARFQVRQKCTPADAPVELRSWEKCNAARAWRKGSAKKKSPACGRIPLHEPGLMTIFEIDQIVRRSGLTFELLRELCDLVAQP